MKSGKKLRKHSNQNIYSHEKKNEVESMLPQIEKNAMLEWFCVLLLPYLLIGVKNTPDLGKMNGNKPVFSK